MRLEAAGSAVRLSERKPRHASLQPDCLRRAVRSPPFYTDSFLSSFVLALSRLT